MTDKDACTGPVRQVTSIVIGWLQTPSVSAATAGVVVSFSLCAWLARISAVVGPSQLAQSGLLLSAALGLAVGSRRFRRLLPTDSASAGWWLLSITAWSVFLPLLISGPPWLLSRVSWSLLESPAAGLGLGLVVGFFLLTLPVWAIARLARSIEAWDAGERQTTDSLPGAARQWFIAAVLLGCLVCTPLARLIGGLDLLGGISVPVGCVVAGWMVYRGLFSRLASRGVAPELVSGPVRDQSPVAGMMTRIEAKQTEDAGPLPEATERDEVKTTLPTRMAVMFPAVLVGLAFACIVRMFFELTPSAYYLMMTSWAALFCGRMGCFQRGSWLPARRRAAAARFRGTGGADTATSLGGVLLLATLLLVFTVGWGGLIQLVLWANAYVSLVIWIASLRVAVVGVLCCLLGLGWRRLSAPPAVTGLDASCLAYESAVVLASFALVESLLLPWASPAIGLALTASLSLGWALWTSYRQNGTLREHAASSPVPARPWVRRAGWSCAVAAVVLGCFGTKFYRPESASRLLFSTTVSMARRLGIERELLPYLDDARLVRVAHGDSGTLTVWKQNGLQYQIRQRGIPIGTKSLDPQVVPEASAETLWAVLPLTLHEKPHQVLMLGLAGGAGLQHALAFPTQSLTCLEWDRGRAAVFRETVAARQSPHPLEDPRLAFHLVDPIWALQANRDAYDIVLCDGGQPSDPSGGQLFTRDFYRQASRALSADGIYCQRLVHADLGPGPILIAIKTLQSVFREVMTVQASAGEMLLLGTNSSAGLVRGDLIARARYPHVRRALSLVGWDWSVMFNLPACSDESLRQLTAGTTWPVNTAARGEFALNLPFEIMRWAPKWQEVQQTFSPAAQRLADWLPNEDSTDLVDRLAEVTAQRELMSNFPDEPWVYRRTVKKRIQTAPSLVEQVKYDGTGGLSPDSKRRLRYFSTLGEAAQQTSPTLADIAPVLAFAEPYDPLVTYFLHQEVAELYGRSTAGGSWSELSHRLHAIYFAPEHDRSVRNVVDAINRLVDAPQAIPDPADRFGHLDALMQMLRRRWENRGQAAASSSRIVLNDVQKSLDAGQKAIAELRQLSPAAGYSPQEWELRETVLRRGVIRPLRAYRNQLTAYHMQSEARTKRLLDQAAIAE